VGHTVAGGDRPHDGSDGVGACPAAIGTTDTRGDTTTRAGGRARAGAGDGADRPVAGCPAGARAYHCASGTRARASGAATDRSRVCKSGARPGGRRSGCRGHCSGHSSGPTGVVGPSVDGSTQPRSSTTVTEEHTTGAAAHTTPRGTSYTRERTGVVGPSVGGGTQPRSSTTVTEEHNTGAAAHTTPRGTDDTREPTGVVGTPVGGGTQPRSSTTVTDGHTGGGAAHTTPRGTGHAWAFRNHTNKRGGSDWQSHPLTGGRPAQWGPGDPGGARGPGGAQRGRATSAVPRAQQSPVDASPARCADGG
jgi:hypothetical protein